jgi:hypothetical protein
MYHFNSGGLLSFAIAMQFNKTQGQALKHVGVLIMKLYVTTLTVTCSRTIVRTAHSTGVLYQEA